MTLLEGLGVHKFRRIFDELVDWLMNSTNSSKTNWLKITVAATSLSRTNKHIHDDNYDHGDNDASAEDDDDAALYLEYQNMQSSTSDDTVYDMNAADDVEVAMSFDEWKTRRKQFKQGADYPLTYLLTYSLPHSQVPAAPSSRRSRCSRSGSS